MPDDRNLAPLVLRWTDSSLVASFLSPAAPPKGAGKEQRAENRMVRTSSSTDGRMLAYFRPMSAPGSGSEQRPQEGLLDVAEAAAVPRGHHPVGQEVSAFASHEVRGHTWQRHAARSSQDHEVLPR